MHNSIDTTQSLKNQFSKSLSRTQKIFHLSHKYKNSAINAFNALEEQFDTGNCIKYLSHVFKYEEIVNALNRELNKLNSIKSSLEDEHLKKLKAPFKNINRIFSENAETIGTFLDSICANHAIKQILAKLYSDEDLITSEKIKYSFRKIIKLKEQKLIRPRIEEKLNNEEIIISSIIDHISYLEKTSKESRDILLTILKRKWSNTETPAIKTIFKRLCSANPKEISNGKDMLHQKICDDYRDKQKKEDSHINEWTCFIWQQRGKPPPSNEIQHLSALWEKYLLVHTIEQACLAINEVCESFQVLTNEILILYQEPLNQAFIEKELQPALENHPDLKDFLLRVTQPFALQITKPTP